MRAARAEAGGALKVRKWELKSVMGNEVKETGKCRL